MPLCLGYTGLDDSILQKYIADSACLWEGKTDELPISTIGSTIGTHTGPGGICVAYFAAK
jgi:fatty acid-binding protein DegV